MRGRVDQSMAVGNEGAGVVVSCGFLREALALVGETVAMFGGAMYSQYRCIQAEQCLALPEGTSPAEGASCFVNPLTSLGMVETMRREGHKALVHTAAASNLGPDAQPDLPRRQRRSGEHRAHNQSRRAFSGPSGRPMYATRAPQTSPRRSSRRRVVTTGATMAFDAIGGGELAGEMLDVHGGCAQADRRPSPAGTDPRPISRSTSTGARRWAPPCSTGGFGFAWGIGGGLLWPFLQKIGPAASQKLRERVIAELKTTFVSHYTKEVSLAEALRLEEIGVYGRRATSAKYLINPNKGLAP